jgi:hypothetical protein
VRRWLDAESAGAGLGDEPPDPDIQSLDGLFDWLEVLEW